MTAICLATALASTAVPGSEPTYQQTTAVRSLRPRRRRCSCGPVRTCVSGFGAFGPIEPTENPQYLSETCTTEALETT